MKNLSQFENNSLPFTLGNHLSFKFNSYVKPDLDTFISITDTKSYVPIPSSVLEHILTTTNLTTCEKLYYILANSLAVINKNRGGSRCCALPSEDWADRLNCSRSLVFNMQSSLVEKGYFLIDKDRNELGLNKRNVITPTLPSSVFNNLNEHYPDKIGEHLPYNNAIESKLAYLDRTKLFIKINYDLLKLITSDSLLNTKQKVMWLKFYIISYKNYMSQKRLFSDSCQDSTRYSFSFISSYREIADIFSSNRKDISKSIRALEKLGFIKAQNIYFRKHGGNDEADIITCKGNITSKSYYDNLAERQDKSLWKITVSLPDEYILELDKVKDRANLMKIRGRDEFTTNSNNLSESYFVLDGIRFNLSRVQTETLKAITRADTQKKDITGKIDQLNLDALPIDKSDSGAEEGEEIVTCTNTDNSQNSLNHNNDYSQNKNVEEKSIGANSDPHVAKSGLYINKYLIQKIKNIKSNLWASPKVIFNNFLKELFIKSDSDLAIYFENNDSNGSLEKKPQQCVKTKGRSKLKPKEFNIHSEFIRDKLKTIPKDKANKARRFAYSLVSKGLPSGYAASLTKDELAKELIFHAATWKPTKAGAITRVQEIDTALSVAWKAIANGKWQAPLELSKALVLEYEFRHHKQKYQKSGIISPELKTLEIDTEKLLGKWCDLERKIIEESTDNYKNKKIISIVNTQKLIENKNYQLESDVKSFSYQQNNASLLDDQRQTINITDYCIDDYLEAEDHGHYQKINLSHIPDQQKYLKVIPSDIKGDDSITLETINSKEYFVKLKELEMNDQGELVLTMKTISSTLFLESCSDSRLFDQMIDEVVTNSLIVKDDKNKQPLI